ncbi:MAG: dihydrodipicolinate reductase C-terminal domain-containing protein, partial [Alistipes sp.]
NYCLGVNFLFRLNRRMAELVNGVGGYQVSIEEVHHTQKKDAPSGTAITLAEGVIANMESKKGWVNDLPAAADQIEIHSVREGTIAGIHTVTYESEDDMLQLRHTIKNRRALAMGAVIAAEFLCGKQGVYSMDDLLK